MNRTGIASWSVGFCVNAVARIVGLGFPKPIEFWCTRWHKCMHTIECRNRLKENRVIFEYFIVCLIPLLLKWILSKHLLFNFSLVTTFKINWCKICWDSIAFTFYSWNWILVICYKKKLVFQEKDLFISGSFRIQVLMHKLNGLVRYHTRQNAPNNGINQSKRN